MKRSGFFMLDRSLTLGLEIRPWVASGEDSSQRSLTERGLGDSRSFLSNTVEERIESLDALHRIALEPFLIAGRQMIRPIGFRFLNAE